MPAITIFIWLFALLFYTTHTMDGYVAAGILFVIGLVCWIQAIRYTKGD